ncbi:hypothetical protein GGR26_002905 [Lewinella marina]|uniref:DUF2490 domain-containing protein n=1 Tax=Neolewinella marina TaxID=438751 RepID=UPI001179CBDE|nr:DUF2490 domain-containing protein [Neolewinella marina]NJB87128.1 hypothetical protein [Neolewinella marina]
MKASLCLTLLVCLLGPSVLGAQKRQMLHEDQEGIRYQNQWPLAARWTLVSDLGFRWRTGFRESNLYQIRTAATFAPRPGVRLTSGLGYTGYYRSGEVSSVEFRPFQEVSVAQRLWGLAFRHRLRLEERFFRIEANDAVGERETPAYLRPRYALQLKLRLLRLSADHPERQLTLTLGDELLLQLGGGPDFKATLRNRLLFGPALEWSNRFGLSLTFTQQTAPTATPGVFRSSEVIWLVVRHRVGGEAAPEG